jgi:hypothetical protein
LAQADEPSLIGRYRVLAVVVSAARPKPAGRQLFAGRGRSKPLRRLAKTQRLAQSHATALGGIVGSFIDQTQVSQSEASVA